MYWHFNPIFIIIYTFYLLPVNHCLINVQFKAEAIYFFEIKEITTWISWAFVDVCMHICTLIHSVYLNQNLHILLFSATFVRPFHTSCPWKIRRQRRWDWRTSTFHRCTQPEYYFHLSRLKIQQPFEIISNTVKLL